MRTIAGMTQDEFAQHRGVSARVIKALELGQGNPTVATLNRIGEFFGLEVGFVPVKRAKNDETHREHAGGLDAPNWQEMIAIHESMIAEIRKYSDAFAKSALEQATSDTTTVKAVVRKKRKPSSA